MRVAILGASPDPNRYSYKAMQDLLNYGHEVVLVNPRYEEIDGHKVFPNLSSEIGQIDTVTVYVGPKFIGEHIDAIIALRPRRVIMNPGAESAELKNALLANKIEAVEACTLVMLRTRSF